MPKTIEISDHAYKKIVDNMSKLIKDNTKPCSIKDSLDDLILEKS